MIRKLREEKKISMRELARWTGIDVVLLSDIERGYAQPDCLSVDQVNLCAKLLEVSPAKIGEYLATLPIGEDKLKLNMAHTLTAIREARRAPEMPDGLRHIKCPKCAGDLRVRIARINGHTHGQCNTEGCLSWME